MKGRKSSRRGSMMNNLAKLFGKKHSTRKRNRRGGQTDEEMDILRKQSPSLNLKSAATSRLPSYQATGIDYLKSKSTDLYTPKTPAVSRLESYLNKPAYVIGSRSRGRSKARARTRSRGRSRSKARSRSRSKARSRA